MEEQLTLFSTPEYSVEDDSDPAYKGKPKINSPMRNQNELRIFVFDDLIPQDHKVRFVWKFVQQLDLSNFLNEIQSLEKHAGRRSTDPRLLLAIWVYATIEGIGSGRVIERYCKEHNAFIWLCGGVNINYHTLNDFRSNNASKLEELIIQSIAILVKKDLVSLERISQDGVRVRSAAGSSSFRRKKTLVKLRKEIKDRLEVLKKQRDENPSEFLRKQKAAELRVAEDRERRINQALKELEIHHRTLEANKKKHRKTPLTKKEIEGLRSSTTDPEARKMKMANGGFSSAYNVQLATDTKSHIIVGVSVTNLGSDAGQMSKMMKKVRELTGVSLKNWLADAGYKSNEDLGDCREINPKCKISMPHPNADTNKDCYTVDPDDSEAVKEWKINMGRIETKEIYKERASTSECINAQARNRGMQQFLVRGINKVTSNVCIFVLTHNIVRALSLSFLS